MTESFLDMAKRGRWTGGREKTGWGAGRKAIGGFCAFAPAGPADQFRRTGWPGRAAVSWVPRMTGMPLTMISLKPVA